jgi:hypothetical protein
MCEQVLRAGIRGVPGTGAPKFKQELPMKVRYTLAIVAIAVVCSVVSRADDAAITGKWTAEVQGRNGTQTQTFTLKAAGKSLTGSVGGGQNESAIENGKVDDDQISFSVTRQGRGNAVKMKYSGKISGDEIKFTVKTEGRDQTQEITAKKAN